MKRFAKSMFSKYKFLILILILLQGCASSPRYATGNGVSSRSKSSKTIKPKSSKISKNTKHRKVMTGVSSFYAEDFHGKLTANGEVYDMYGVTAAHKTYHKDQRSRTLCERTNSGLFLWCRKKIGLYQPRNGER